MKSTFTNSVLTMGCFVCLSACADGPSADSMHKEREIERVQVPDSRFKPTELEATIDNLVSDVEAEGATKDIALGVVLKDLFDFWRPAAVGANRALSELEIPGAVQGVTNRDLDIDEKTVEQLGLVDAQHALGYQGLALAPFDAMLAEKVNQWVDEGKPVVTIDSDLPETRRQLYIGTDNARAGITGAETLLSLLDAPTGRIILLGHDDPIWDAGYTRTHAAANTLAEAGYEVQIISSVWAPEGADTENVRLALEDETYTTPVVGMLGVFSNAYCAAEAALGAGLPELPVIVAFDFVPQTLDYMAQGIIRATHAQRQYYMGYLSVYATYAIQVIGLERTKSALDSQLIQGFHLDTGLDVIHFDELDEWNAFVDELGID